MTGFHVIDRPPFIPASLKVCLCRAGGRHSFSSVCQARGHFCLYKRLKWEEEKGLEGDVAHYFSFTCLYSEI